MNLIFKHVLRHKAAVTVFFIAAAVICVILQTGVSVNYSLVDYLPPTAESTVALKLLSDEFKTPVPNTRVMLRDVTLAEALEYKAALSQIDGVSNVTWLDDVIDLKKPVEYADHDVVAQYYSDGCASISLTAEAENTIRVMNEIYDLIGEENSASGEAVYRYAGQSMAGSETRGAMMIAIPLIILVLLLSTSSWLEPLLFLFAIGAAVFINSGINFFIGEVSFITNAVSPILQLAVSMDYAIFLLHSFADYRGQTDNITDAMRHAMRRASSSIAASATTTLFGFVALCFMNFGIGTDLGLNLAKGVVLSYISVMIFLPALTLCCYKLIDKTKHRDLMPQFKHVGRIFAKVRVPLLLLALIVAAPCFLAQNRGMFSYGTGGYDPDSRQYRDDMAIREVFGTETPIVLLVPRGEPAREAQLCRDLVKIPHVTSVLSYAAAVGIGIPPEIAGETVSSMFYSENLARIIVYTDTEPEGAVAFSTVESVRSAAAAYYEVSYSCGESANLYDIKNIVQSDHTYITWLAIGLCALVILVTFRSLTLPVILLMTIEISIWINISVSYFTGTPLSYIGFLVISTVQLGATVDYAILFTDHYKSLRREHLAPRAAYLAYGETFRSILVSAATLTLAGIALDFTSTNPVVQALGLLLTRGTVLSFVMVNSFLPAALVIFDKVVEKTTVKSGFLKSQDEKGVQNEKI